MPDKIRGNMLIIDSDSDLLAEVPGLTLPSVEERNYVLLDDDAKVCRVISEDELEESYVDNNIETYQILEVNLLTLAVDNEFVTINYRSGDEISILLGSIDLHGGGRVEQYAKRDNVIFPIDDTGRLKLDATNTPGLVAIRTWYLNEARRVNDERMEIAEVVHAFAGAVGVLGNTGHLGNDMTGGN